MVLILESLLYSMFLYRNLLFSDWNSIPYLWIRRIVGGIVFFNSFSCFVNKKFIISASYLCKSSRKTFSFVIKKINFYCSLCIYKSPFIISGRFYSRQTTGVIKWINICINGINNNFSIRITKTVFAVYRVTRLKIYAVCIVRSKFQKLRSPCSIYMMYSNLNC